MAQVLALLLAAALAAQSAPAAGPPEKTYNVTIIPVPAEKKAAVAYVGPLIVFKALVGGREVWAVVDSGAAKTAMDIGLARELRLRVSDSDGAPTAANVPIVIPGQFTTRYQRLPALDLSQAPGAEAGRKIGFVLGQDFLRGAALSVDPARHTFELGPSGALAPPGAAAMALPRGQVILMIGEEPVRLTVDTGFNGQISLTPAAAARFVPKGATKVPELSLGPATISDVVVAETPAAGPGDGAIGLGLLNHFSFALDLSAGTFWIAPLSPNGG